MSSSKNDILTTPPKALTFDVFGTVVDWRKTVTLTLIRNAAAKILSSSKSAGLSPAVRLQLSKYTDQDWGQFAQEWRNSYKEFVHNFIPGETEWKDVDTHHYEGLLELLTKWKLEGLYTKAETEDLAWSGIASIRGQIRHRASTSWVQSSLPQRCRMVTSHY